MPSPFDGIGELDCFAVANFRIGGRAGAGVLCISRGLGRFSRGRNIAEVSEVVAAFGR